MNKLFRSAIAAFGSLATFAPGHPIVRYSHATEWDALKSDWSRIGFDMKTVIERENGKIKKTSSSARASA